MERKERGAFGTGEQGSLGNEARGEFVEQKEREVFGT